MEASARSCLSSALVLFELCIFNQHKIPELVGYYDDVEAADTYIAEHQNADIYITPQIINPSLTQRGHNMMVRVNERTTNEAVFTDTGIFSLT